MSTEIKNHKMKLWVDVYTISLKNKAFGKAKSLSPSKEADNAVNMFDKRFSEVANVRSVQS